MSTSSAPVIDPTTTDNGDDDDALTHRICRCQRPLPIAQRTTYCGRKLNPTFSIAPAGTNPPHTVCVVCLDLQQQPCRHCGKDHR